MAKVHFVEGWGLYPDFSARNALDPAGTMEAAGWQVWRGENSEAQLTLATVDGVRRLTHVNTDNFVNNTNRRLDMIRPLNISPRVERTVIGFDAGTPPANPSRWSVGLLASTQPLTGQPSLNAALGGTSLLATADATPGIFATGGVTSDPELSPIPLVAGVNNWVELVIDPQQQSAQLWVNNRLSGQAAFTLEAALPPAANHYYLALGGGTYSPGAFSNNLFEGSLGPIYVADTRLGRCRALARFPTIDAEVQFTRTQGESNASQVADREGLDGDTTFVSSASAGAQDTYSSDDPLDIGNAQVHAVAVTAMGRRVDVGAASLAPVVRNSGATAVGAGIDLSVLSYLGTQSVFSEDPATNSPWSTTGAMAHTFGFRLED